MSKLTDKIEWAIQTFNEAVARRVDGRGVIYATEEEAIKANLGLLFYVKQMYPGGRFPAWARDELKVSLEKIEKAGFSFHD